MSRLVLGQITVLVVDQVTSLVSIFLHDMEDRHLLKTDGGRWRFRHRLPQEYFAGMWEDHEKNPSNIS